MSSVQSLSSTPSRRPITVTIAVMVMVVSAIFSIVPIGGTPDDVPMFAVYGSIGAGIISLIAAAGLWRRKKWAAVIGVIMTAINLLLTAPGIAFAPTVSLQAQCATGVALDVAIIALILMPVSRRAYA